MRMKKLICAAMAAVLLLFPAAQCAAAGSGGSYSVVSPSGKDGLLHAPDGEKIFDEEPSFSVVGDAEKTLKRGKDGSVTVTLTGSETGNGENGGPGKKGIAVVHTAEKLSADAPGAAAVSLLYTPAGEASPQKIDVLISFISGSKKLIFRDELGAGVSRTVFCDLSSFGNKAKISSFSVSAEWSLSGDAPGKLAFSEIRSADGEVFKALDILSSSSVAVDSGAAAPGSGGLTVTPTEGKAELRGALDPDAIPADGDGGGGCVYYAEVRIDATSGSVSAEFSGDGKKDGGPPDQPQNSPSIQVQNGEHSYMFRIPSGSAKSYVLTLRSSDNSPFTIKHMKIYRAADDPLKGEAPCSVTRNEITDGVLCYEARLIKSASVRYVGQRVSLCTSSFSGGDVSVLATAKATNTFSFKASVKDLPQSGYENLYWVEVGDGDDGGVPITKKQFPAAPKAEEGTGRFSGLHGADPAGVFETGVSRTIVDVDLDLLTGGSESMSSSVAVSRGSNVYYVDGAAVARLDSDIKFYASSGVNVYLRLLSGTPSAWFTLRETDNTAEDRRGLDMYLALVSFFRERYANISSVIVPDLFGGATEDGGTDSPWDSAYRVAMLMRLTSSAASRSGNPVFVTLPVGTGSKYGATETEAALIAEALYDMGPVPWSVISFSSGTAFPEADTVSSSARANGTSFPSFAAICYVPDEGTSVDSFASTFKDLYRDGSSAQVRAVFLSLSSVAPDGLIDDFSVLSPPRSDGGSRTEYLDSSPFTPSDTEKIKGSRVLWDFSDSYSTGGWTVGTGIESFGTVSRKDGAGRALRCRLGEDDAYGIVLCTVPEGMSFTRAPLVEFDLSVEADRDAEIVFLFGDEDGRAEYSAKVAGGESEIRTVCDLTKSEKPEKPGYMAVMIRSDGAVTVDFNRIVCHSTTLTSEEISEIKGSGRKPLFDLPDGPKRTYFVLAATVTAVAAVLLAVHCIRSDRDFTPTPARRKTRRGGRQSQ